MDNEAKEYEYTVSEYAALKKVHVQTVYLWKKEKRFSKQPDFVRLKKIGTLWVIVSKTPKLIEA